MNIWLAGEGERLKLGPPLSGEVTLLVSPQPPHNALAMGMQSLPSGHAMQMHRHLEFDEVWFVHKGQGRATVEEVTKTVVPGATISIPRGTWHNLRNTGTGLLQIVWMSAPSGMEQLFRELSQPGAAVNPAALQAIAQRYGTEFRADHGAETPSARPASPHRHRHRRGRRGAGKGDRPPTAPAAPAPSAAVSTSETLQKPPPPAHTPPRPARGPGPRPTSPPTARAPRHPAAQRRGSRHRHPHMKEVYMGGRWIKVTGEGPIISTGGHEAPQDT